MKTYLIDEIEVIGDGDWYQCPYCQVQGCIIERFFYCPMCGEKLNSINARYD